ncbi:MAG TPA: penicillin-binding transpeptidase domain-containing protein, partial [Candidatus Limnocylindrales bacterium]|nr:penicillin-binding transpeptidase domain-containing protein [Candidatus Limnocylindrales bacterium]
MRGARGALAALLLLAACSTTSPDATPAPTSAPRPDLADARAVAADFLDAWAAKSYVRLFGMLAASDRVTSNLAEVSGLLRSFDDLARVYRLNASIGSAFRVTLPPEPRPPDAPAPIATPTTRPSGAQQPTATASAQPTASPTPAPPDAVLDGPVSGVAVPVGLHFSTGNFGNVDLARELVMVEGSSGWQVRWSPSLLFPELAAEGTLSLDRSVPVRGRIIGLDGTVWAETRDDGTRVYPQEWLAGQTIGYAGKANAEDLVSLASEGVRAGDLIGRTGLELGADALLRGSVGFTLSAVPTDGDPVPVLKRETVPGADVVITLRRSLQASAQAQIAGYNEAGTAVLDPRSGDIWALASAPVFNPNAMTLGTTLAGQALASPTFSMILNHATLAGYPAGSSFKVFTLAAALQTGVASPATRMTCNGTWVYSGFTFRNYEEHSLPGRVDLKQAMAFSCNTTYMPLSIMVYEENPTALTDLVRDFGFGQLSGMRYLPETRGILPDDHYFELHERWDG